MTKKMNLLIFSQIVKIISVVIFLFLTSISLIGCSGCFMSINDKTMRFDNSSTERNSLPSRNDTYYNSKYSVTKECAKDVFRAAVKDIPYLMEKVTANDFERIIVGLRDNMTQIIRKGGYLTFGNYDTGERFRYYISKNNEHLKLVLFYYRNPKGKSATNTIGGFKKHPLTNCKCD